MIRLTRINGQKFFLNSELIEQLESTPDTVITLINGKTVMVAEPVKVVVKRIIRFKQRLMDSRHITNKNSKSA